jgi:serine protease Do
MGKKGGAGQERSSSYYLYGPLLAHDAKLNAGVDGTALLNLDGELIGLATSSGALVAGERGESSAFPADHNFRRIVEVLRRGEEVEYGMLGVRLGETLRISVSPRGPAALAGLLDNDLITHVNGVPVNSYEELFHQVGSALAGSRVKVTFTRGDRSRQAEVTLAKFTPQPFIASARPEPVHGLRVEYTSVGGTAAEGVCVREVVPDSPAAAAFKKLGDRPERWVVTHVNGVAVNSPPEFSKAAKGQASVKLTVYDPADPKQREREVTLP